MHIGTHMASLHIGLLQEHIHCLLEPSVLFKTIDIKHKKDALFL